MKRLIINADDYGLTGGCMRAIMDAMESDVVTSTSVLVWSEASIRGTPLPSAGGVHLRLTDGHPVLPIAKVPSLVTEDGTFPRSQEAVAMAMVDPEQVRAEWMAQVLCYLEAGGLLTHIDTHRHTHALLNLQEVYADMCVELGCAGVPLSRHQRDVLRARGVPCADVTEIRWMDGRVDTLLGLLEADFAKHETVYLMCHPGYNDAELQKCSTMTDVRAKELDVLLGIAFQRWRQHNNIKLIGIDALEKPANPLAQVDLVFLAWNRREFTTKSLAALRAHTDWSRVRRTIVYDDGSIDGTLEVLRKFVETCPSECHLVETSVRSPVAIMNDYLVNWAAPWFAKIDSDTIVPPDWLHDCLRVLRDNPHVDLLGIEATCPLPKHMPFEYSPQGIEIAGHIGGIGLMRSSAFEELPEPNGRMGFSQWQIQHDVVKAWLNPSIPVILLDRLPFEPWASLSAVYEEQGWQRPWQRYDLQNDRKLWEWWIQK